ncbi:MAG: hypothetical protein A4E57_00356 [Syntrophorhabdaceae bacterium PtaU1.Bin034]|jgi:hypothetical protein|nr:MAG: hypothetical protein A4E57_00356 [Syntrophorhabdaceae bacterium PtaU1.Bin034]
MEPGTEARNKADAYTERKFRLAREQGSIVLAPRMRDLHLLTRMLFTLDKAINRMRMNAGTASVSLPDLEAANERVVKLTARIRSFTAALGGTASFVSPGADPAQKDILVQKRNSYVFMPKTAEGTTLAGLFISLDSAYFEYKIKSPLRDIERLGEAIETMKGIVRDFLGITSDLAAKARVDFVEPKGLAGYFENGTRKEEGAAGEEA